MPKLRGSKKRVKKADCTKSSTLLPARNSGESLSLPPYPIKQEPDTTAFPAPLSKSVREDAELDDFSNTSVETQPTDMADEAERRTTFENVTIKTEPLDDYDHSTTSSINNQQQAPNIPSNQEHVPSELRVNNIKTEPPDNCEVESEKETEKRKIEEFELDERLELLQKANLFETIKQIKSEPTELPSEPSSLCNGDDGKRKIKENLEKLKKCNISKKLKSIKSEPVEPSTSFCNNDSQGTEDASEEMQCDRSEEAAVSISYSNNEICPLTTFSTELLNFAHLNITFDKADLEEALEVLSEFTFTNRTEVLNDSTALSDDTAPVEQTAHVANTDVLQSASFTKITENPAGSDEPKMYSTFENKTKKNCLKLFENPVHLLKNLTVTDPTVSVNDSEIPSTNFQHFVQQPAVKKRTGVKRDIQASTCSSTESVNGGKSSKEYFNKAPPKKISVPSSNHILPTNVPSTSLSPSVSHSSIDNLSSSDTRMQSSSMSLYATEENLRHFYNTSSILHQISSPATLSSISLSPCVTHLSEEQLSSTNIGIPSTSFYVPTQIPPSPFFYTGNSSITQPSTSSSSLNVLNLPKETLHEIIKAATTEIQPVPTVKAYNGLKRNVSEVYENGHSTTDTRCNEESVTQRAPKVSKLSASSSLPMKPTDPRVARRNVFSPRKGSTDLELYQNIGRDFIEQDDFVKIILQWNPDWLLHEQTVCPPIFDVETYKKNYKGVKDFYRDKDDKKEYYNTYVPLLFLHIWLKISENWSRGNVFVFSGTIRFQKEDKGSFVYECACEFENRDQAPEKDSILLCQPGKGAGLFMHVAEKHVHKTNNAKFKLILDSVENVNVQTKEPVDFIMVFNCRLALLQNRSLRKLCSVESVILNPSNHRQRITYMELELTGQNLKEQRDYILSNALQNQTTVTLLDILHNSLSDQQICPSYVNLIKFLAFKLWKVHDYKVLICMENKNAFEDLVYKLSPYNPVLLVRGCEAQLKDEHTKYILEKREDYQDLHKKNTKALTKFYNECHIFITLLSAYKDDSFFLNTRQKFACIIHNAHICTEPYTAMPLSLKPDKLILFGNQAEVPSVPIRLKNYSYNLSLYQRLLKSINMKKN